MQKHDLVQYDTTGLARFEPSWYATVWEQAGLLRMQVKGLPYNTHICMDARIIPQLINVLKIIQNEKQV